MKFTSSTLVKSTLPKSPASAVFTVFSVASVILKHDKSTGDDLAEKQAEMEAMKAESKGKEMPSSQAAQDSVDSYADVKKIIFACDAGMGSSAMGASLLRDKVKKAGIKDISVTNTAVNRLKDEQGLLVVTQEELAERALQRQQLPIVHYHFLH